MRKSVPDYELAGQIPHSFGFNEVNGALLGLLIEPFGLYETVV